jgi:hypothetical protein
MESQEPRWKIFAEPCGLVDFSRLAHEFAARLKKIRQKHGVSASIETLDALRYGKINQPWTRCATEKSTSPQSAGRLGDRRFDLDRSDEFL